MEWWSRCLVFGVVVKQGVLVAPQGAWRRQIVKFQNCQNILFMLLALISSGW